MEAKLPDVCHIQYGFAFDSAQFSSTTGIPLIRIRDVVRGYSETYTTENASEEYFVNDGDLLIGMDGEFNIARWQGGRALLNQRVCRLIPNEKIDKGYLFYFMPQALKKIEEQTPFVTVKHLSAKQLNSINISLPALDKQRHVALVLDKINSLISLRKQQLAKLDELVKVRFVEMFGDPVTNPRRWPVKRFEEICTIITDGEHITPDRAYAGIYLLSARNIQNHSLKLDDVDYIDESEFDRISKRLIPQKDDILLSCSGSIGRCCRVLSNLKFQMVRSVALLRFDKAICPIYAEYLITSDEVQRQIQQSAVQSSQANLFQGKIRKLKGYVPPLEMQVKFSEFVEQMNKARLTIQQSLAKLEVLKKALMQEYFE